MYGVKPLGHFRRNSDSNLDDMQDGWASPKPKPLDLSQSVGFIPASSTLQSPSMSPSSSVSTAIRAAARTHQYRMNAAQEHRSYHDTCQRLLTHISAVTHLCNELYQGNKDRAIYYPPFPKAHHPHPVTRIQQASQLVTSTSDFETASQPDLTSSLSTMSSASSVLSSHEQLYRRMSVQSEATSPLMQLGPLFKKEFNVLHLDLKIGHASTSVHTLEQKSIASLLDEKLLQCQRHLLNLHNRVADTSSKVLITGDLNAGKSTFVNALLKREMLPADQQPCTNMFCEVLDATVNDGFEQIHAIPQVDQYDRLNPDTYHLIDMRHLHKLVMDDSDQYQMVKVYTNDARATEESLLHNGVVDIALIDSPGLNTDSVKTTAVFARQEEIDVVVFVVSAENHFTLSGKEFLLNAANEKTHIFIVVNRFDSIRDKDRCKRMILEQIRQLSPATYDDADDLVHFVSSGSVDLTPGSRKLDAPEFARLEERLRAFVLGNRAKSKLLPAKNYLVKLLLDIGVLAEANMADASAKHEDAAAMLEHDMPAYEQLMRVRDRLLTQVERMAESTVSSIRRQTIQQLREAVEQVQDAVQNMDYPGLLFVWQYAQDMCDSMSNLLVQEIRRLEGQAKNETEQSLVRIHEAAEAQLDVFPRVAQVDRMFLPVRDVGLVVQVEATDFFDIALDERLSGAALSVSAMAMLGSRMMGIRTTLESLMDITSVIGSQNMRRLALPLVGLASAGFLLYVVNDMPHAVKRKLVRKFKQAALESSYIDQQGRRIARASRKVLRVEGWETQTQLQRAIEIKESRRNELQLVLQSSQEAYAYYTTVYDKANALLSKVDIVQIDQCIKLDSASTA
ncbi:hypothetical protein DM01DRAFT_1337229 [Hesseltinella vesiculosa]|uniref:Dynamin-type G domain-containing protein n=1 Tax=Hesseltinella vesiculosa TaxID=101127 RepID=A0A1X2GEC4_9FUNG|nr:hypothetical protein DM01DRAFT_1337229 [Hesseltinella vesiculosa]